jgi:hypothetical protein
LKMVVRLHSSLRSLADCCRHTWWNIFLLVRISYLGTHFCKPLNRSWLRHIWVGNLFVLWLRLGCRLRFGLRLDLFRHVKYVLFMKDRMTEFIFHDWMRQICLNAVLNQSHIKDFVNRWPALGKYF